MICFIIRTIKTVRGQEINVTTIFRDRRYRISALAFSD